jgi:hypothetical protein
VFALKVSLSSIGCVAILVGLGCSNADHGEPNPKVNTHPVEGKTTDQSSAMVIDLGVATLSVPIGWEWRKSNGSGFGGVLVPYGTKNADQAERLIQIHVGEKRLDLDESANSLAKKFDGSVSELPFQVDGERALRISFKPTDGELLPREGLGVVRKSTNLLFLSASPEADERLWPNLQEIAMTLKWTDAN